jgi:lamin tail-like protein/flagellar hook capping protein FlgD
MYFSAFNIKRHFFMKLFSLFFMLLAQMLSIAATQGKNPLNTNTDFELVITEVFSDPTPSFGLPEVEYVEIFNRSQQTLNLSDYEFYDGSHRTLPPIDILPGEYVIICDDEDTVELNSYGKVAWVSSMSLTNSGESLALYSTQGALIDSVKYSVSWFADSFKENGGWSLERIDNDFTCYDKRNWQPSVANTGGTPGTINSMNGVFTDLLEPVALHAFPISSNQIVLVFSEAIEIPSGTNYISVPGLNPVTITGYHMGKSNELLLTLNNTLQIDMIYFLISDGFQDCSGNISFTDTIYFGLSDTTSGIKKLLVNEVLYDPLDGCPEFVEIVNGSKKILDLVDYKIARLDIETGKVSSTYTITASTFLLIPGGMAVVSSDPSRLSECYTTPYPKKMITPVGMPSLTNGKGRIALLQNGVITDDFLYDDNLHHPLVAETQGVTLERLSMNNASVQGNWHSASSLSGYGTPGFPNSQLNSSSQTNDWIMLDPSLFSPDNDGVSDILSINIKTPGPGYLATLKIYNTGGNIIKEFDTETLNNGDNKVFWNGVNDTGSPVTSGPYILYIEMFNPDGDIKRDKKMFVVAYK